MIPVCNMIFQQREVAAELEAAVTRVMKSGVYMLGEEVKQFEQECANYLQMAYGVGVGSGTEAIMLALQGLGLGKGDEVIVPANSYPTIWGVLQAGVTPIICDVEATTGRMAENYLTQLISPQTKAILVVHLYGVNMLTDSLLEFAKQRKLLVIEDCAQSFGAKKDTQWVGSRGDIATLSFYPTKPLGGYGDGGMILTQDSQVAQRLRRLRMYGEEDRYHSVEIGINSRLDEIQAALLRVKLPRVEKWREERQVQANIYRKELSNIKKIRFIDSEWMDTSAFHLFVIITKERDKLQKFLRQKEILTAVHYPLSITTIPSLYSLFKDASSPVAQKMSQELLSLPLYNGLTEAEQSYVVTQVKSFFG